MSGQQKKHLIFFDFDNTVAEGDTFHLQLKILNDPKEEDLIDQMTINDDWIKCFTYFFSSLPKRGITIDQWKEKMNETKMVKGMKALFDYLGKHKDKYEIVIISAGHSICIEYISKHFGIRDDIDFLICQKSEIVDGVLVVHRGDKHECKSCNPSQCKSLELKKYLENAAKEGKSYKNITFVCDGGNDFCMSSRLGENDFVCCRKNFKLHKDLFEGGKKDLLKTKNIYVWDSGEELIDVFEKMN